LLYDTSPTVLYTLSLHDALPILNFLDVFGSWDPSLAFVMGGAVIVAFFGYRVVLKRRAPLTGGSFRLPSRSDIDSRILVGPAIFGVGWGISGFCPGPAITALALGAPATYAFVPAMIVGMWAARLATERLGVAYAD